MRADRAHRILIRVVLLAGALASCKRAYREPVATLDDDTPREASLVATQGGDAEREASPPAVGDTASLVVTADCGGTPGAPVTRCRRGSVSVDVKSANSGFTGYLDETGSATLNGLPAGDAVVTVRDGDDPRHPMLGEARVTLVAGAAAHATVAASPLDASQTISGVLLDGDCKPARPIAGTSLFIDLTFRGFRRSIPVTAADGSFTIPNLPAGACTLTGLRFAGSEMRGGYGLHTSTEVVAPVTGVKVSVEDRSWASRDASSPGTCRLPDSPTVLPGTMTVTGRMPRNTIERIVKQNLGRIRLCYRNGLRKNAVLTGEVTTTFVIGHSGDVVKATLTSTDLPDSDVAACVVHAFEIMPFPQPEVDTVTVVFPIAFSPNPEGTSPPRAAPH